MPSQTIYRPRRLSKILSGIAVIFCLAFFIFGLLFFYAIGIHLFSFAFTGLGLIGFAACVSSIFIRIVVSADGIKKSPWITAGFILRWEDIDSWSAVPPRFDDPRLVRFRIRGRRLPRVVADHDVENPGFEAFLEQIREFVPQKEIVKNETNEIYHLDK